MSAPLIVLIGSGLVIAAIIGIRLHAFLALIGAALIVVSITPEATRMRSSARAQAVEVQSWDASTGGLQLTPSTQRLAKTGAARVLPGGSGTGASDAAPSGTVTKEGNGYRFQYGETGGPALKPGDWLVAESDWNNACKAARLNPGEVVAQGFGNTTASIGLLIALASVIGACLMESGAAERIVVAIRKVFSEERASLAFVPSGFLICIPAFFDTVFYLLMPLGKALRLQTGRDYLLYILSIVAGATMAHSLVPPTPGPLFVADALKIKIGTMMLGGAIVGLVAATAGYLYACWANRRWDIPLRETAVGGAPVVAGTRPMPPLGWSLLPILLPIVLIAVESFTDGPGVNPQLREWVKLFGNKNIALALGTVSGLILLASMRQWNWRGLSKPIGDALEGAGTILLITPAGGAFGHALRMTDIAGVVSGWFSGSHTWLLPAAFGITMLVRLAQGSATVAMITGVGIIAPVAAGMQLNYNPVYLALAIGCGSKPISWMNDSGFWIISRMSGMTETETLKSVSAMMAVMGFVGFAVVMIGAKVLPLV